MHFPTESAEINVSFVESVALSSPCCPSISVCLTVCLSVRPSLALLPFLPATVCDFAKSRDVLLGAKTFYLSAYTQMYLCACVYYMYKIVCVRDVYKVVYLRVRYLRLVSGKPKRFKSACPKAFSSPTWPCPLCAPAVDCAKLRRSLTFGIKRIRCVCEKNKQKKLQRRQQQQHYARVC